MGNQAKCWMPTSCPGIFLTGLDSPVRSIWSTFELPLVTLPSIAIFSPGLTSKQVPISTPSAGTSAPAKEQFLLE
jgi:hypothetical protein